MPKMISDELFDELQKVSHILDCEIPHETIQEWRNRLYGAQGLVMRQFRREFPPASTHVCTPACLPDTGHQQLPPLPTNTRGSVHDGGHPLLD